MHFWKDYICNCIQNLAWAWDDVAKDWTNSIWKKTLKNFVLDFKGFAKDERLQINKSLVEMANNFNLRVDEDDIEELLEVVPEELTNEESLELERELIAEEAKEKETSGEVEESPRKLTLKDLTSFFKSQKLLKRFEI